MNIQPVTVEAIRESPLHFARFVKICVSPDPPETATWGIFSSYVLGGNIVEKIMSPYKQAFLESPWGQKIFKQGFEEGLQEARQEVVRRIIGRMIRRRFGEVSEAVEANLQRLNREQLETVAEMLIDGNSLEELMAAFPPVTDN